MVLEFSSVYCVFDNVFRIEETRHQNIIKNTLTKHTIIKNTLHTGELKNYKTTQQPIFTETHLLKQPHTRHD